MSTAWRAVSSNARSYLVILLRCHVQNLQTRAGKLLVQLILAVQNLVLSDGQSLDVAAQVNLEIKF